MGLNNKSELLEAAEARHGGDVSVVWHDTFLLEKYGVIFFSFPPEPIAIKLLTTKLIVHSGLA